MLWSFPYCRLNPGIQLQFASGERGIPLAWQSLQNQALTYDVPLAMVAQGESFMYYDRLNLFIDARHELNLAALQILDASGWSRHGTLSGTGLWSAALTPNPTQMLRLGGASDSVSFGNVLADDAVGDFWIEFWVRFPGANGVQEEILTKKALVTDNSIGWGIYRSTANQIVAKWSTGAASISSTTSGTILQNTWKKVDVTADRDGNLQVYLNGVADGTPTNFAGLATGANALNLYLGRDGTNFGQIDVGAVRIHFYTHGVSADQIPSAADIATQVLAHYNAEKSYYGL
jgi:hypothetical protein